MAELITSVVSCSLEEAKEALSRYGSVENAIDALSPVLPVPKWKKFLPAKPVVAHMHDDDQQRRCELGREFQNKVNALHSVAHSQTSVASPIPVEIEKPLVEVSVDLPQMTDLPTDLPEQTSPSLK